MLEQRSYVKPGDVHAPTISPGGGQKQMKSMLTVKIALILAVCLASCTAAYGQQQQQRQREVLEERLAAIDFRVIARRTSEIEEQYTAILQLLSAQNGYEGKITPAEVRRILENADPVEAGVAAGRIFEVAKHLTTYIGVIASLDSIGNLIGRITNMIAANPFPLTRSMEEALSEIESGVDTVQAALTAISAALLRLRHEIEDIYG